MLTAGQQFGEISGVTHSSRSSTTLPPWVCFVVHFLFLLKFGVYCAADRFSADSARSVPSHHPSSEGVQQQRPHPRATVQNSCFLWMAGFAGLLTLRFVPMFDVCSFSCAAARV